MTAETVGTGIMGRLFPEKRIFVKSGETTRFVRLGAKQQVLGWVSGLALVGWAVTATSVVVIGLLSGTNLREEAVRDREVYETRLNAMAEERKRRVAETDAVQVQLARALDEVSRLQVSLLDSHIALDESREGTEALRRLLRDSMAERDDFATQLAEVSSEETDAGDVANELAETRAVNQYLIDALGSTAGARDLMAGERDTAETRLAEVTHEYRLSEERSDRIFSQLEEAVSISMEPLEKMFTAVGMEPDRILNQMRNRNATGQGGPLEPIALSTSGSVIDPETARANEILAQMDQLAHFSAAAHALPFASPVTANVRQTSGFGYRRDPMRGGTRLHSGTDWAGAYGTPIYATATGTVTHAGWQSGYGRLVKIQHEFGVETRFAHLANINVQVGQRVSRGDKIGAMGNSGRSTGTHLHYEVRVGERPVNPLSYIRAGRDVF